MEKGDRLFDLNKYEEAIPFYKKEIKTSKGKIIRAATLKLADCYRLMNEFEEAEKVYKQLISRGGGKDAIFSYGMALKAAAKYAEAKEEFLRYNELDPEDPKGMLYARSCDSAQKWLDAEANYDVFELLEFNTPGPEISPVYYKGGLMFSSERKGGNKPFVSFEGGSNDVMLDLYYVDLDGTQNSLYNEIFFFPDVNTDKHEGPSSFSPDGREMYYTKTVAGERMDKGDAVVEHTLQIFYSFIAGDTVWSDPISALPFNSIEYSVMHPAISPDGRKIFFASDMPGGFGGTDIYVAYKKDDGEWTKPYNLGPEVNTFGFELYPFYDGKGHLYFSSNGLPGMGRLDIFKSTFDSLYGWSHINNMKVPVNSIGDDICYVDDGSGERGFIVSNRINGTGNDDIYVFNKLDPLMLEFENGLLKIEDNSLYTGLAFKVKNMQSGSSEYMEADEEGYFNFQPELGVDYVLSVRKNMFLVNKIDFRLEKKGSGKQEIHVNSRLDDVRIRGFIGEVNPIEESAEDTLADFLEELRGSFMSSFTPAISFGKKIQEISVEELLEFDKRKALYKKSAYAGIMTYHLIEGAIKEKERTDHKGIYEYKLASTLNHVIRLDKVPENAVLVETQEEIAIEEEKEIQNFDDEGPTEELGLEKNGDFYEGAIQLTDGEVALGNQSFVLIEEGGKETKIILDEFGVVKLDSLDEDKLYTLVSETDDRLMPVSFTGGQVAEAEAEKFEFEYLKKSDEVFAVHEKNSGKLGWNQKNELIDCKIQAESQEGLLQNEKFQVIKDGVVVDEVTSDANGLVEINDLEAGEVYTLKSTNTDINLKPRALIPNQMKKFEVNQVTFDDSDYSSEVLVDKRNKNSLGWEERGGALNAKLQVTVDGRLVTDEKYVLYKDDKEIATIKVDDRGIADLSGLDEDQIYTLVPKDTSLALPPMSFVPKQLKEDNHLVVEGIGLGSHKDKIEVDPLIAERLRWITDGETVKSRVLLMSNEDIFKDYQVLLRKDGVIVDTLISEPDGTLELNELEPLALYTVSSLSNEDLSHVTFRPQDMWYTKKKTINLDSVDDSPAEFEEIPLSKEEEKNILLLTPGNEGEVAWSENPTTGQLNAVVQVNNDSELLEEQTFELYKNGEYVSEITSDASGLLSLDNLDSEDKYSLVPKDNDGTMESFEFTPAEANKKDTKVFNFSLSGEVIAGAEELRKKKMEKDASLVEDTNQEQLAWFDNDGLINATVQVNHDEELLVKEKFEIYKGDELVTTVKSDKNGLLELESLEAGEMYTVVPADNEGMSEEFTFTPEESKENDQKVFNFSLSGEVLSGAQVSKNSKEEDFLLIESDNEAQISWQTNEETGLINSRIQVNNNDELLSEETFELFEGSVKVGEVKSDENGLLSLEDLNPDSKYTLKPLNGDGTMEDFEFTPAEAKGKDKQVFNFSLSGEVIAGADVESSKDIDSKEEDLLLIKPGNKDETGWYTNDETGLINTRIQVNNNSEILEEETFLLYQGDELIKEVTSDENGLLSLEDLDANTKYSLKPMNSDSQAEEFEFVPKDFQEKDKQVFNFCLSGEVLAGATKESNEEKKREQLLVAPKNRDELRWNQNADSGMIEGVVQVNKGGEILAEETFLLFKDGELIAEVTTDENGLLQLDNLEANAKYDLRALNEDIGDETFSFTPQKSKDKQQKVFNFSLDGEIIPGAEKISNKENYSDEELLTDENKKSVNWERDAETGMISAVIQVNNDEELIQEESFALYKDGELTAEVSTNANGLMKLESLDPNSQYVIKPSGGEGLVEEFEFNPAEANEKDDKVFNFSLSGEVFANAQVEKSQERDRNLLLINPQNADVLGWELDEQGGLISGKIQINSDDDLIANEKFLLYDKDGELVGQVETNEFGLLALDNLNPNEKYTLKALNSDSEFEEFSFVPSSKKKEDDKVFNFSLSCEVLPGASISKTEQKEKELLLIAPKNKDDIGWTEESNTGKLTGKVQINSGNNILENETFEVYKDVELIGELETNENGLMSLEYLNPNERYTIKPTDSNSSLEEFTFVPQEAKKDDVNLFDFSLSGEVLPGASVESNDKEKLLLSPKNELEIGWSDAPDLGKINGKVQVNNDSEILANEEFLVFKEDELIGELETDDNGLLSMEYLDPNEKYTLKPVNQRAGMQEFSFTPKSARNENVKVFDFQDDQSNLKSINQLEKEEAEKEILLIEPKNEFVLGWEEDGILGKLNGKVQINSDQDLLSNETFMVYKGDELVGELVTDENGLMSLEYLDPNESYTIKPLNQRDDVEEFTFTPIDAKSADQKVFDFQSEKQLMISKLNQNSLGWRIEGAKLNGNVMIQHKSRTLANETFLLYQDGELIGEIKSNEKGEINLDHLDPTLEYSLKPINDLEGVEDYKFISLNAKNGGIKIFDLRDGELPVFDEEIFIDPKVMDRLGWKPSAENLKGTIQVTGAGDILPKQSFELWKDGQLIKEVVSDEFGIIDTDDLDPNGMYTLKPKDPESLLGSFSFVPDLMNVNGEEVVNLPTKADSDPAVIEDFIIFFEEITVEELFLNITEPQEGEEKLAIVVLKNGNPLGDNQVEFYLDDALVSLNQTDSLGAVGEVLNIDRKLTVKIIEGDEEFTLEVSKDQLELVDGVYRLALDLDNASKESIYGLDSSKGELSGIMKIETSLGYPLMNQDVRLVDETGEMIIARTDSEGRLTVNLDPNKIYQLQYVQDGQLLKQVVNPLDIERNQETKIVLPGLEEGDILGLKLETDIAKGKIKLLSSNGDLLPNAPVRLIDENGNIVITETDDRGYLDLNLDPDMSYNFEYIKDGVVLKKKIEAYSLIASDEREIRLPSINENEQLGLKDKGGLSVGLMKILESDGTLVANAPVRLVGENGEVIITETNRLGYLDLELDPNMSYSLEYIKDGIVLNKELNSSDLLSSGDKEIILPRFEEDKVLGLEIKDDAAIGKLKLMEFDGEILPSAPVRLVDSNGEVIITETNSRGYIDVELDPNMDYSLEYIKNGEILKKEFKPSILVETKQTGITLPESKMELSTGSNEFAIGKLAIEESNGEIVANAPVRLVDENGDILIGETDEKGQLDVELQPDMSYSLEYIKGTEILKQDVQTDLLIEKKELTITLPAINESEILGLEQDGDLALGKLKLTDFNGNILPNAPVRLVDPNEEIIITETDENGFINLQLDPNMDYSLEYIDEGNVLSTEVKPSLLIDSKQMTIALPELKEDEVLGLETRGSLVMGKLELTGLGGQELANKTVRLIDENGNVQVLETDDKGRIDLAIAPKGKYSIEYLSNGEVVKTEISSELLLDPKTKSLALNAPSLPSGLETFDEGLNIGSKSMGIPVSLGGASLNNQMVVIEKDGVLIGKYRTDDLGKLDLDLPEGSYKMYVQDENGIHEISIDSKSMNEGISFPLIAEEPSDIYSQPILMALKELGLDSYANVMLETVPGEIKTIFIFENEEDLEGQASLYKDGSLDKSIDLIENRLAFNSADNISYTVELRIEGYEEYIYSFIPSQIIKNDIVVVRTELEKETLAIKNMVTGRVFNNDKALFDVEVKFFEEGEDYGATKTDHDGRFTYQLRPSEIYTVSVLKNGFESKQITFIPEDLLSQDNPEIIFYINYKEEFSAEGHVDYDGVSVPNASVKVYKYDKVVYRTNTDSLGNYSINLREDEDYVVSVTKEGFFQENKNIKTYTLEDERNKNLDLTFEIKEIQEDESINLTSIYFDYGSTKINQVSKESLDRLVDFMNSNPNIEKIEISSHTDQVGSAEFNLALSQQRAKSVENYLVKKGIPRQKIVAIGYGETKPLIKKATTEQEQRLNRRTEFKVVKYKKEEAEIEVVD